MNTPIDPAYVEYCEKRIADLERQVAALTKGPGYWRNCHDIAEATNVALREQLAAAQAVNERLREALAHAIDVMKDGQLESPFCEKALALPNDTTALQARLAEEREKCASIAREATAYTQFQTVEHYKFASFIEDAIRSMK